MKQDTYTSKLRLIGSAIPGKQALIRPFRYLNPMVPYPHMARALVEWLPADVMPLDQVTDILFSAEVRDGGRKLAPASAPSGITVVSLVGFPRARGQSAPYSRLGRLSSA
jgi:hypothetical protein